MKQYLKRIFTSRLNGRIALAVFLAIIVVEGGILFFSIRNYERDRLHEVEREAVVVTRAIIRSTHDQGSLVSDFPSVASMLRDGTVLVGARVFDNTGKELNKFGKMPSEFETISANSPPVIQRRIIDNNTMDVLLAPPHVRGPYWVAARIDTSEIAPQIVAFVWRIVGLVVLISGFVTVVTMLVLDKIVLSPINNLSCRLTLTGDDLNHPEKYIVPSQRSDEWGDVLRAFNGMLQRAGTNLQGIRDKESELQLAKEDAEKANRAKSEFLSFMSHEIRTPMTGVMGFADLLDGDDLSDASREKVEQIKESTRTLLSLLNEILDLSKLEAGKLEIDNNDFDLPSLIDQVRKLMAGKSQHLELAVNIADDISPTIHGDASRLRQVLLNLIGNAIKFTEHGSITIDAALIEPSEGEDMLHLAIHDTGIGLSEESMAKLFSDFVQADSSISRKYQGTGLGLSICRRLIQAMGGEIGVESQLGVGSTFWFTLPYAPRESPVQRRLSDINLIALRPLNILLAEDNAVNRRLITAIMEDYGHQVEAVEDGAEVVAVHVAGNFDLILMDIRMPVMNGLEATAKIRQLGGQKSKIPIVALTADAVGVHEGVEKMDGFVTKPIERTEFLAAVNKAMGEDIHVAA